MRRLALHSALTLSIAATLALAACSGPMTDQPNGVAGGNAQDGADSSDSGNGGDGFELPSDWPSELPVPRGEVIVAFASPGSVSASFLVDDMDDVDSLFAEFISAGYELLAESESNGTVVRGFANDTYRVNISAVPDGDKFSLTYVAVRSDG